MRCILFLAVILSSLNSFCQVKDFWNVDFGKADSIALAFAGRDLKNPDGLARELVQGVTSEVEKFRVIFRWIADNISYDYDLYLKIVEKEKKLRYKPKKSSAFAERASKQIYRNMILKKKTICSGYATLLEYMCQEVGLQCKLVSGYGRTFNVVETRRPNHAWNAVKLGYKWYLCDVTWASGFVGPVRRHFFKEYNDIYFLTEPSLFISSHYPSDPSWTLLKERPTLSHFLQSPLKPEGFIQNLINQYAPYKGYIRAKADEPLEVRFTSNAGIIHQTASIHLTDTKKGVVIDEAICALNQDENGEYVLTHTFEKRGYYYLHIWINGKATFVYRLTVV